MGHYSAAFVAKRIEPRAPLWVLFLGVQLVDVFWAVFVLTGIEKARLDPALPSNPLDLYYMPFTHGLGPTVLWGAAAFAVARWTGADRRLATVLGLTVCSHWVADLLVHRPDLPLYDDTLKLGLGLWNFPVAAFLLEIILLGGSVLVCLRAVREERRRQVLALGGGMLLVQVFTSFGPVPQELTPMVVSALVAFLTLAAIARRVEGKVLP